MPLQRYLEGEAHVLPADNNLIRFGMTNGERIIGVELPIDVMRNVYGGGAGDDPLDLYMRNREAIEATASKAYDGITLPNDLMQMGPEDFGGAHGQADVPPAPAV